MWLLFWEGMESVNNTALRGEFDVLVGRVAIHRNHNRVEEWPEGRYEIQQTKIQNPALGTRSNPWESEAMVYGTMEFFAQRDPGNPSVQQTENRSELWLPQSGYISKNISASKSKSFSILHGSYQGVSKTLCPILNTGKTSISRRDSVEGHCDSSWGWTMNTMKTWWMGWERGIWSYSA